MQQAPGPVRRAFFYMRKRQTPETFEEWLSQMEHAMKVYGPGNKAAGRQMIDNLGRTDGYYGAPD